MVFRKVIGEVREVQKLSGVCAEVTEEPKPTREEMERVLREWGVLPERPGELDMSKLERRYTVFSNIDYGEAPSPAAMQAFRDKLLPCEDRLVAT